MAATPRLCRRRAAAGDVIVCVPSCAVVPSCFNVTVAVEFWSHTLIRNNGWHLTTFCEIIMLQQLSVAMLLYAMTVITRRSCIVHAVRTPYKKDSSTVSLKPDRKTARPQVDSDVN